jgi:arginase
VVDRFMAGPYVTIDLEKIEYNARTITNLCAQHGIEVTGVTKVTCGIPQVGKAMLRGGVTSIGESRLENILRQKANGVHAPFMLLRIPPLSAVEEIVTSVDISLNSERSVIVALSESARKRGLIHDIILMVDLGDLREGIWPDDLMPVVREVVELEGVRIVGLGTNLSCYGGVVPTEQNMRQLVEYARQIEGRFNVKLHYISGGNSSSLNLIASGKMPKEVNHVRIGEGILLGRETVHRMAWPDTYQDAFLLRAEVIELKEKPSVPIGEISEDAFGHKPTFEDKGEMFRAILNIGREDVDIDGINPIDSHLSILGASSDHLLLDVTAAKDDIQIGDDLGFTLNYGALLATMTSMYVEKRPLKQGNIEHPHKGVVIIGVPTTISRRNPSESTASTLIPGLEHLGFSVINTGDLEMDLVMGSTLEVGSIFSPGQMDATLKVEPIMSDSQMDATLEVEPITAVIQIAENLAEHIEKAIFDDYIPVVLSADPITSLGVYLGLGRLSDPPGLIVFSAYGGFQVPDEEHKGHDVHRRTIRRMVLASTLGYGDEALVSCGGISPKFEPENVVLVGLREVEPEEVELITRSRIKVFTMEEIDSLGMREVSYRALRAASMGTTGLHVTLDLSVLDPTVVPGILDPVKGGISYREMHLAMEMIARSGLLRSLDVVGFSPDQDAELPIAKASAEFVLSLFGKKILGRYH